MTRLLFFIFSLWAGFPSLALAGDPGPLCAALLKEATVVEIELEVKDPPPRKYLAKNWQPERIHYGRTLATARIIAVYRGPAATGAAFPQEKIDLVNLSIPDWKRFFEADKVRVLTGGIEGWAADNGTCNASACQDYESFLKNLKACLTGKMN